MTAADNITIGTTTGRARSNRMFRFLRIRSGASTEFFPGGGTTIRYANRDVDTLTMPGLPAGLLDAGDRVRVQYLGSGSAVRVFEGTAEKIVDMHGRGDERVQTVTCHGPWGLMNRLVFRQAWSFEGPNGRLSFSSGRVVLNQTARGLAQDMTDTVREICAYAADRCGFAMHDRNVVVAPLFLPFDETRDVTCASAIQRELRFFPRKIVRFDYSVSGSPEIHVEEPSSGDAAYVLDVPKTSRKYEYTAHPVKCVDVYVQDVDSSLESPELTHQFWPEDADLLDDIDCLHAYIPLAPGSSSTTWKSFDCVVEDLPNIAQDKGWWLSNHPRLRGVSASSFTIVGEGVRTGTHKFPRIARATAGELEEAGLQYEVETFRIKARISNADDTDEDVILEMTYLMTNGLNRTYTWQTGSSSTAGETLPDGLAKAIFEQRSGSLLNEEMTIRLGAALPTLGDGCDGLLLQEFTVDCGDLTAELHFGQPEWLSVEDMRDLLNGFRQRGYASNAPARMGGEQAEDYAEPVGGIPPISTSAWSPGYKSKTTIRSGGSSGTGAGGTVRIDSADVSGETARFRTVTIYDKSGNAKHLKVLGTPEKDGAGQKDDKDDAEDDPHMEKDPHGNETDPCNPEKGQDPTGGGGGGGGAGTRGGTSSGVMMPADVQSGGAVSAGRTPGDSQSPTPSASGCC